MRVTRLRRTTTAIAVSAVAFSIASACGGSAGDDGLKEVKVGLANNRFEAEQATYSSLPAELGFWKDEGLKVKFNTYSGSGNAAQGVLTGQSEVAAISPNVAFASIASGKSDLVSYYDQASKNFQSVSVPEKSPIRSTKELKGMTVGVQSLDSASVPMIKAMAAADGVDPDTLKFIDIGDGASALRVIKSGKVDVSGLNDGIIVQIENLGFKMRPLTSPFDDLGFQLALTSRRSTLKSDRDVLIGIARGIAKATLFATTNPEAAVRLHWKAYPETKPNGVSDKEAMSRALKSLKLRLSKSQPAVDGQWGSLRPESIETAFKIASYSGLKNGSKLSASDVWTDKLLQEVNNFDHQEVIKMAKEWSEGK